MQENEFDPKYQVGQVIKANNYQWKCIFSHVSSDAIHQYTFAAINKNGKLGKTRMSLIGERYDLRTNYYRAK